MKRGEKRLECAMDKKMKNGKFSQFTTTLKRAFPNLSIEIAAFVLIAAIVLFSVGMAQTANIGQEISMMNVETADDLTDASVTEPVQQVEFEVAGEETVVTEQTVEYQTSQMCFIGDSRTLGMQNAALTDAKFIAQGSTGIVWFDNTASVKFGEIKDDVELCVVLLGINDISNVDKYITSLNSFADQYPDKTFVYTNLGPVGEKYSPISNESIETFNNEMLMGLVDRWQIVDLYSYLTEEGFNSNDGLHYSSQDSAKIFYWIVDQIKTQTIIVNN